MTASPIERHTILLVDDEPLLRAMAARVLKRGGYEVIEAEDGHAALALCAADGRIDLIVTDIRMPRLDGLRLAAACRTHRPELPVLFMSGDCQGMSISRPFLAKPFLPQMLAASVRELLL